MIEKPAEGFSEISFEFIRTRIKRASAGSITMHKALGNQLSKAGIQF